MAAITVNEREFQELEALQSRMTRETRPETEEEKVIEAFVTLTKYYGTVFTPEEEEEFRQKSALAIAMRKAKGNGALRARSGEVAVIGPRIYSKRKAFGHR